MDKEIKYTVAVVLKRASGNDEFLVVKRPSEDVDLGGHWGFPATTLLPGELPTDGAERICREKLGCECEPIRFLGIMFQKRNSYDIFLMDMECALKGDSQPDITKATTKGTRYTQQKWVSDPLVLMDSAKEGSCCSSLFLTDRGLLSRQDWIGSLEGSEIVG